MHTAVTQHKIQQLAAPASLAWPTVGPHLRLGGCPLSRSAGSRPPDQLAGSPRAGAGCRQAAGERSRPRRRKFRQVLGPAVGASLQPQRQGGLPAPGTPRAARRPAAGVEEGKRGCRPPTPPRARPRRPGSPRAPVLPGEGRRPAPRRPTGGQPATLHEKMLHQPAARRKGKKGVKKKNVRR